MVFDETYARTGSLEPFLLAYICGLILQPILMTRTPASDLVRMGPLVVAPIGGEKGFIPGAQEIFNPGLASGDYHGQMDGSNFEKWYNKKFLPNLPSNSIIVMDNASYRSVQTDRAPTTATRKADIQVRSSSNHAMVYYLFSFSILVKMYCSKQCRPIIHLDFVISIGDYTVG